MTRTVIESVARTKAEVLTNVNESKITVFANYNLENIDLVTWDCSTGLSFICTKNITIPAGGTYWFDYPAALETSGLLLNIVKDGTVLETHLVDFGTNNKYSTNLKMKSGPDTFSWFGYKEIFLEKQYGDVTGFKTAVDVGGNIGLFSLFCWNSGVEKIITIEPDPKNLTHLYENRNIAPEEFDWNIIPCGVSYTDGKATIERHNNGNSSSLFPDEYGMNKAQDTFEISTFNINSILDGIDGPIDILKLDCEGGEFPVFRTITKKNISKIKNIVCEIHEAPFMSSEEIITFLKRNDFNVRVVSPLQDGLITVYANR